MNPFGIMLDIGRAQAYPSAQAGGVLVNSALNAANYVEENPLTVGLAAGQFVPSAGTADFYGRYPDPVNPSQLLPSAGQNLRQGNYLDVALQSMGLLGDALYAAAPFTAGASAIPAAALSAPRAAQLAGRADRGLLSVDMPAGSFPEYQGRAPDRSGGSYQRYIPKKNTDRMERLISKADNPDDPINSMFDGYIEKGVSLGGESWYNTEELRDWFVSELGEQRGDAEWRDFINLIGATSTGSNVPSNLRNATFYRALPIEQRVAVAERVSQGGITPAEAAQELGITIENLPDDYRYGHLMQRNQASNVVSQAAGDWDAGATDGLTGAALSKQLKANPKVKGFANSLLGDTTNIAADKHFMRMLAMSDGGVDFLSDKAQLSQDNIAKVKDVYGKKIEPYITERTTSTGQKITTLNLAKASKDGLIKDTEVFSTMPQAWLDTPKENEYAALEEMANRLAPKYGMTPAQFQASLWMGAGDITDLADESQGTAMELFRRTLDNRAEQRGLTREEMLKDFIVNRAPLAVPIIGGGTVGLLVNQEQDPQNNVGLVSF